MKLLDIFRMSIESLLANKFRNFLALFGIMVGVSSVMLMISLGTGTKDQLLQEFSSVSANCLIMEPDTTNKKVAPRWMSENDLTLIKKGTQFIEEMVAVNYWQTLLKYKEESLYTYVIGTSTEFTEIVTLKFEEGRFFNSLEESSQIPVCIIGNKVKKDVFQSDQVIGSELQLGDKKFKVIGVLQEQKDVNMGFTGDQKIYIPETILRVQTGVYENEIVLIKYQPGVRPIQVQEQIKKILSLKYQYVPFLVTPIAELQKTIEVLTTVLTGLLGAIGSIALVVGGIGITNIMLVTVSERTREIGIKKALGAKGGSILLQFITEAIVLCMVGGGGGLGLGYLGAVLINLLAPVKTTVDEWTVFLSIGFAVLIGMISGIYPAWKAQKLDPIQALNTE